MEYMRKLADPTYESQTTAVSKFKLVHPKDSTYAASKSFFKIITDAVARHEKQSPIRVCEPFVLVRHHNIVKEHTKLYQEKSTELGNLDKKIMAAVLLALVAMHTPFIPFIGVIAIAGWMAALYLMSQRAYLYIEYHDALLLLVATCSWCLGADDEQSTTIELQSDFSQEPSSSQQQVLLANTAIQAMMDQLYLVLSKQQISHLLSRTNWAQYRMTIESHDNRSQRRLSSFLGQNASQSSHLARAVNDELESPALKQRSAEFIRCIYGLNRGSGADFLRVFLHAVPDFCYAVWQVGQKAFTSPASPAMTV